MDKKIPTTWTVKLYFLIYIYKKARAVASAQTKGPPWSSQTVACNSLVHTHEHHTSVVCLLSKSNPWECTAQWVPPAPLCRGCPHCIPAGSTCVRGSQWGGGYRQLQRKQPRTLELRLEISPPSHVANTVFPLWLCYASSQHCPRHHQTCLQARQCLVQKNLAPPSSDTMFAWDSSAFPPISYHSSPPQQLAISQCCYLQQADYRAPEIAKHHPFSHWVMWGTKNDESFLPRQEMIDLNNCLRIFTWHSNTVAVMITNVSVPHSESIIGISVSDNLYSNTIFTLSQFWIVANISCDSHFIIQRELSQAFGTSIDADCHWISPFPCLFYSLSLVTTYSFFVSWRLDMVLGQYKSFPSLRESPICQFTRKSSYDSVNRENSLFLKSF